MPNGWLRGASPDEGIATASDLGLDEPLIGSCPRCGREADWHWERLPDKEGGGTRYRIACAGCDTFTFAAQLRRYLTDRLGRVA